jgi:predicted alpha/beta hydrolase family esterase
MKTAVILHGRPDRDEYYDSDQPSASNAHWLPWLQNELIVRGYAAHTPEVPLAYDPQWSVWLKEIERYDIDENTTLVGHSTGAGFWVRYLSERPHVKVGKVVLVAPWIDVEKNQSPKFFDFEVDPELASRTDGIIIMVSDDDMPMILSSVKELESKIKDIKVIWFKNKGHFCESDLGTKQFPELLHEIVLR